MAWVRSARAARRSPVLWRLVARLPAAVRVWWWASPRIVSERV
jgi:hypothetical protein